MVEMRLLFIALFIVSIVLLSATMKELDKYEPHEIPSWLLMFAVLTLTAAFISMLIVMVM